MTRDPALFAHLERVAVRVAEAGARKEAQQQPHARRVHGRLEQQRLRTAVSCRA